MKGWTAVILCVMLGVSLWAWPAPSGASVARTDKATSTDSINPQQPKAARQGAKPKRVRRITPQIPKANRYQPGKVFLENADILSADENRPRNYQLLKGHVRFRRGDMYMFCDSAYFYEQTGSIDAFGHVKLTQSDTLTAHADILHYYGYEQTAQLRRNVRVENRSIILTTDSLDYEVGSDVGYYFDGGKVYNKRNATTLTSEYGRYEFDTKQAEFSTNVHLVNKRYDLRTNELLYNTRTQMANIVDRTIIISDDNTIRTQEGWYNLAADDATLYRRALITTKDGRTLQGDTVYYNQHQNWGEARGNVVIHDPKHKVILDGGYGYHDDNTHYSFVTRRARAREFSQKDTIYLHADTLLTLLDHDSVRVLRAFNQARFFRSDVQGVADSLQLSEADTILNLYRHAVLWNGHRQVFGDEINVHIADSTVDWATMPSGGFMAEHLGEVYYDQLTGKKMKAYFENKEMRRLDVDGNVQVIMFPQEKDSTYNKMVSAQGSYLRINLKAKQEVDKIVMWPDVNGRITPLYLSRKGDLYLPQFQWLEPLRPQKPDDIFNISDELKSLLRSVNSGTRRRSTATTDTPR